MFLLKINNHRINIYVLFNCKMLTLKYFKRLFKGQFLNYENIYA